MPRTRPLWRSSRCSRPSICASLGPPPKAAGADGQEGADGKGKGDQKDDEGEGNQKGEGDEGKGNQKDDEGKGNQKGEGLPEKGWTKGKPVSLEHAEARAESCTSCKPRKTGPYAGQKGCAKCMGEYFQGMRSRAVPACSRKASKKA